MKRRDFLRTTAAAAGAAFLPVRRSAVADSPPEMPNFIVIFCDDLGYGDIGCFGSKLHRTPNLDRMAAEGARFTSFYSTSGVCTPSRASLMTGCYPKRVSMHQNVEGKCVIFPVAKKGLNPAEITAARLLKTRGYATMCIGKWHLGDQRPFLPTRHGFDSYFGIPYSNDMVAASGPGRPPLPLLRDEEVIEAPVPQDTLTQRYTQEAVRFIREYRDEPFFLYLPHSMPHNPVHASERFRGRSANGRYGDAVEEIDWSVGEILRTLRELGIDKRTLVIFTSDNGAHRRFGGSNAPLRGWKGSTWEGGMRVPCVMYWPGTIPAGLVCDEVTSTMDILPTFAKLAGAEVPKDRIIDGHDISALMTGQPGAKSPYRAFFYYQIDQLQAVRSGRWKLHLPLERKKKNWGEPIPDVPLQLYDLKRDISESRDVSKQHPDVVERLFAYAEEAREDLGDVGRQGQGIRPAGYIDDPVPLVKEG